MGYEISLSTVPGTLWKGYRDQFAVTRNSVYLNHAGIAPLCRPAAEAMQKVTKDAFEFGSYHYGTWLDAYEGLRVAAAKLVGGHRDEIAIVKNTSEGIATVALGLDWRPGDTVVCFREEFPANYFPWQRLESKGVRLLQLSIHDSYEQVEEACRGARLLAVSFVQYLSGHRTDLQILGEICHRHGVFFFVDAIQGLGVFPVDVQESKIHALAADGHKWLLGPEGCGILFVAREVQDRIEPVEFGWTNVAGYNDYESRDTALRRDAGRYECGTLNTVGIFGLRAAIEFVLSVGIPAIQDEVLALAGKIRDGVRDLGFEVLGSGSPERMSGIVSFRRRGVESGSIVRQLQEKGYLAAPRQGWVRTSPHFYISPLEIDELVAELSR